MQCKNSVVKSYEIVYPGGGSQSLWFVVNLLETGVITVHVCGKDTKKC